MGEKLKTEIPAIGPGPANYEVNADSVLKKCPMPVLYSPS